MKWFRRIFGTPTRDELAELMIGLLHREGATAIQYDPGMYQIRLTRADGSPVFQNLHNAYLAYGAARPWQRGSVLHRFASTSWQIPPAATWEEAVPRLRPGIRDTYLLESARLQTRLQDVKGAPPTFRSLTDRIGIVLIEDHKEHMSIVPASSLETWGVSFDQALETALANLREVSAPRWTTPFPGVYISAWNDDYDASRLLLDDELSGVPVALVPHRSCLIVTGSDDDEALARALALAEEAQARAPGTISVLPLRRTPSGWSSWEIGSQHPCRETFHRLRLQEIGGLYNDQKQLLDAILQKEDVDVFVASYSGIQSEKTGALYSYCVWTRDVAGLLPRTELIGFCDPEKPKGQEIVGFFHWEEVQDRCSHLMPKANDDGLPRYRIEAEAFPSDEDFQAMKPVALR
jgi:hypothetical protein